jgi:predicted nuclease of restriction endonuclease-like (RecB) superfamily
VEAVKASTREAALPSRRPRRAEPAPPRQTTAALDVGDLHQEVRAILHDARRRAARNVNAEMVRAYWQIGQTIVEHEQKGKGRADYGQRLIESLAERLTVEFGRGFTTTNLKYMRQFHLTFPIRHALGDELSWTHYRLLLKVDKPEARAFYEQEAADQNWSTRELERQITSLYYERALMSTDKRPMLTEVRRQAEQYQPADFVRDPYVLEFLGLKEPPSLSESQLEGALLDHIQEFLLELGKGFSFVARQQRITLDGDHFYIDLVFYNRLLRCFVVVELKIGKLTHQDLGQLQMYVNHYTRELREEWENPAIGILLCADKNDAVVRYTLPEGQQRIFASRYQLCLPTEEELAAELTREHALLRQQQGLQAQ